MLCDLIEEQWPSMDLVAEMLLHSVQKEHADAVEILRVCPPLRRRFSRAGNQLGVWFNSDRLLNRFWDYPRLLRRMRGEFELFHVVDHAYAQLVHSLPPSRTVVTCHDLHTFQCLIEPESRVRSAAFRAMTRRVLDGMRRAARVVFDTSAVRDEVLRRGLLIPEQTAVVHLGVHPVFSAADAQADADAARLLGPPEDGVEDLMHVGGTFARKRIDLLLEIFAAVRRARPAARLIRVGGAFTPEQERHVQRLGLSGSIVSLPFVTRELLAAVYRRAALVLIPSEEEGFGLPVIEAMTCGTPVVASALPVLREVGGEAASYCPVGEVDAWREAVLRLLEERAHQPAGWAARRAAGRRQAEKFTWNEYARKMVEVYHGVLSQ